MNGCIKQFCNLPLFLFIFKETDDGKVSKSSRNATKPIVQVFGYGAGDESQINGLISSLMEKIERGALDYINGKSTKRFKDKG